jgi:hypothetical protein
MQPGDRLIPTYKESWDNRDNGYRKYTQPGGDGFIDDDFENPLRLQPHDNSTQAQNVWMSPYLYPHPKHYEEFRRLNPAGGPQDLTPEEREHRTRQWFSNGGHHFANWWANRLKMPDIGDGKMNIYEVRPSEHPQPWNLSYGHGWAAPSARVVRKVPREEWENPPSREDVLHGIDQLHHRSAMVRAARAPWNPAGGPLWRGMRVRWSPDELVRLHDLHDSGEHETLAHTILDRVQHGSGIGEWHMPREDGGGLGVFWSGSPEVSQGYSHHGDGHDPAPANPFENVMVQAGGYDPADEWTPYDEDAPHDEEPNNFLNEDRETDLYDGAPLDITHVHVNAPGGPLSIPLTRPRRMTAALNL